MCDCIMSSISELSLSGMTAQSGHIQGLYGVYFQQTMRLWNRPLCPSASESPGDGNTAYCAIQNGGDGEWLEVKVGSAKTAGAAKYITGVQSCRIKKLEMSLIISAHSSTTPVTTHNFMHQASSHHAQIHNSH